MPKMKSHSGAKKRFRVTKTGRVNALSKVRTISLPKSRARERWASDKALTWGLKSRPRP